MKNSYTHDRLALEEQDHVRMAQEMKAWESIALLLVVAFAVLVVRWLLRRAREEVEFVEKLAEAEVKQKRREEATEKRAQLERIERIKLKRERLRRKPKIEVIEEDET